MGDFNIRNNNWDLLYLHHSTHMESLKDIANSFNLELSTPIDQVPTQYTDNFQDMNLVLDLMFLCANTEEFNNYFILPSLQEPSDHILLVVHITIEKEFIQEKK